MIHSAAICESKQIGTGTTIWAFVHILPGAVIGKDCNICDFVFIENQVIFNSLKGKLKMTSIVPTTYEIDSQSVYSFLV